MQIVFWRIVPLDIVRVKYLWCELDSLSTGSNANDRSQYCPSIRPLRRLLCGESAWTMDFTSEINEGKRNRLMASGTKKGWIRKQEGYVLKIVLTSNAYCSTKPMSCSSRSAYFVWNDKKKDIEVNLQQVAFSHQPQAEAFGYSMQSVAHY